MPHSPQSDNLIAAITQNDLKQAYLAIKEGADVNCFFFSRYTDRYTHAQSDYLYVLHYAVSLGHFDMVTLLLENGAYRYSKINLISDEINESVSAAIIAQRCDFHEIYNLIVDWTPRKARVTKRIAAELQQDSDKQPANQMLIRQNKLLAETVAEQANEIARLKATVESLTKKLANKERDVEVRSSQLKSSSDDFQLFRHRQ